MELSFLSSWKNQFFILLFLSGFLLFSGLGKTPIYILDEARNAQCAREMLQRKDFVVPTFNNELRQQKPPLHYYAMMTAYSIFGVNAFSARFFSAVCGLLLVLSTFLFVMRFVGNTVAFLTGLILISSTHFLFEFRLSVPDPYLILFFSLTLFFFYVYLQSEKTKWLVLAGIAVALAVLSKGPVALALAGLPILVFAIWEKKIKLLFKPQMILALLIFLLMALPWYILVDKETNGEFTRGFFLEQNLKRFNEPMEGHGGLFILVPLFVIVGLLPFSAVIYESVRNIKIEIRNPLVKYCILISLWIIIVFSISSTKLPNYPMLCYPFAAIILAIFLEKVYTREIKLKSYVWYIVVGINLLLGVGVFIALRLEKTLQSYQWWGLLFFGLAIGCILVFRLFKRQQIEKSLFVFILIYSIFNFLFLNFAYANIYHNNPVTTSLSLIKNKKLYSFGLYNPAFNFYVNEPIIDLGTPEKVTALWRKNPKTIVVAREESLQYLNGKVDYKIIHKYRDIFELPITVLIVKK